MSIELKFDAAVNVIRNLPKNGPFQPSNELMLRFYAYFKQATQGPCSGARPQFWDLIGRAKYDAWKKLGDMSKEEAMSCYVEELHTIVETMSYSDKVANFLEAPTTEYDRINMADLELIAGDVIERVRSRSNSPIGSRETSPIRVNSVSQESSPSHSLSSPVDESDHSDDEYIDTIEVPEPRKPLQYAENLPNGYIQHSQTPHQSRTRTRSYSSVDISQEISKAVQSLKEDIEKLNNKIISIENSKQNTHLVRNKGFFAGVSTQVVIFMFVWPFVAHILMNRFISRRY